MIPENSIIHLHTAQAIIPEIVFLVSRIKKIPFIAHIHSDVEPSGKMGFLLPLYKKIFLHRILRSASRIIVPSRDYVTLISKKYKIPETKICQIPNGVDLESFKSMSAGLHNPVRLLTVCRLSRPKNIPLLIQSFKLILEKRKWNVVLQIVGEGEEKNRILNLIKKEKLEKKAVLYGNLRGKDLHDIYSNSDIFILTSGYESFGIVLIEAMASGLPVVVSNITSVKNIIKNNITGLLAGLTPEDFSAAVIKLIGNSKLREKLIKNGLKEVKKYDWDKIVRQIECIYNKSVYINNGKTGTKAIPGK